MKKINKEITRVFVLLFSIVLVFSFFNVKADENGIIEESDESIISTDVYLEEEIIEKSHFILSGEKKKEEIVNIPSEEVVNEEEKIVNTPTGEVVDEEKIVNTPTGEVVDEEKIVNTQIEEIVDEEEEIINNPTEEVVNEEKEELVNISNSQEIKEEKDDEKYKVYFTYNGYKTNILGGEKVFISDLLNDFDISINLKDIINISVSDNNLFNVSKIINGNWAIESVKSFDTEEKIIIDLVDGSEYIIDVTDPVGQAPDHTKTLTPNVETIINEDGSESYEEDGTYNLSLTVTGEADLTKSISSANVLIIYDVSSSMTHYWALNDKGSIGGTGDWSSGSSDMSNGNYGYFRLYKKENDSYIKLRLDEEYVGVVYRRESENKYVEYNGDRYLTRRAEAGERTLRNFVHSLFEYQDTNNPDNVEVAFIQFANGFTSEESPGYTAGKAIGTKTVQTWTSNESDITNHLTDSIIEKENLMTYMSGTNYESALQQALVELGNADGDQTYVIFVTDGEPSQSVTSGNVTDIYNGVNAKDENGRKMFAYDAIDEIEKIANYNTKTHSIDYENGNTSFYGIYAFGREFDFLDDLVYYANNGVERPISEGGVTGSTVDTLNYYNAMNTDELEEAVSNIFDEIIESLGIVDITINDGTTSTVKVDSGSLDSEGLLDVDDTSFKYYLSLNVSDTSINNEYSFKLYNSYNAGEFTYIVTNNQDGTISIKLDDSISNFIGAITNNTLKFLWGDYYNRPETSFYYAAPQATFVDGSVKWDLSSLGILLDKVTYEVTFDVWPSQTTYDLIADLKNGYIKYDDLQEEVKTYLKKNESNLSDEDASYTLLTNTKEEAFITYVDKRVGDEVQTSKYIQPDPVNTASIKMLGINKIYKAEFASEKEEQEEINGVELWVTKDGVLRYQVELNKGEDKNYSGHVYISLGIITEHDGELTMKTSGRDYGFREIGENAYHWELKSDIIRPMLINNKLTILKKIDEPVSDGYTIIKITKDVDGKSITTYKIIRGNEEYKASDDEEVLYSYYEVGSLNNATLSSTMVNEYRSNLDIIKEVTGDAKSDDEYDFKITVTSAKSHNPADEYIWFSVADLNTGSFDPIEIVTDATLEVIDGIPTYYYYVQSGLVFDDNGNLISIGEGTQFNVKMKNGYSLRIRNILSGSTYLVEEIVPDNYILTVSGKENTNYYHLKDDNNNELNNVVTGVIEATESVYQITYTNDYQLKKISIIKNWADFDNIDGTRPESITIHLLADGNEIQKVTLNKDSNWKIDIYDLPIYQDGKEIKYTVLEDEIESYESIVSGNQDEGFVIKNIYSPQGDGYPDIPTNNEYPDIPTTNPKTGDNIIMYLIMLFLSVISLLYASVCLNKNRFN